METPTIPQVRGWSPSALDQQATEWSTAASSLNGHMEATARSVDGSRSYWAGKAATAMHDRHETVAGDATRVRKSLEDDATAARAGSKAIASCRDVVLRLANDATAKNFEVDPDGTVKVSQKQASIILAAAGPTSTGQAKAFAALRALAQEAETRTTAVNQGLASVGQADTDAEQAITKAFSNLASTQLPTPPGGWPGQLTGESGAADGKDVAAGHMSNEDLAAIADRIKAAGLTPQQVDDIAHGKPAELGKQQWDYLHEFYNAAGKDGLLSMTEQLSAAGNETHAAGVVDGLNTLANPSVRSAGFEPLYPGIHAQGGMNQVPQDLRGVLTSPATTFDKMSNQGQMIYKVPHAEDLSRVSKMMGLADAGPPADSDIKKELILRASDLAGFDTMKNSVDNIKPDEMDDLASQLLRAGSTDHGAVHDVFTGDVAESKKVLDPLMHHQWKDDGAAVGDMFKWIEGDSTSPDLATSTRAGETASSLAHYISGNSGDLLNMNGAHSEALGAVNPKAVQGFSSALHPYIADMVGAPAGFNHTNGFESLDAAQDSSHAETAKLFSVIDSNKDAASVFNSRAIEMSGALETAWTQGALENPDRPPWQLANQAGSLQGLVEHGLDMEANDRTADNTADTSQGFQTKGDAYDSFKAVIEAGASTIPGVGPGAALLVDGLAPELKSSLLGIDPGGATADPNGDFHPSYDAARQYYQIAQVLQADSGGTLPPGLADETLVDPQTGELRGYDAVVAGSAGVAAAEARLTDVVNNYNEGALHENTQDFVAKFNEGRNKALGR